MSAITISADMRRLAAKLGGEDGENLRKWAAHMERLDHERRECYESRAILAERAAAMRHAGSI
jgi:hypothetical protein